jgi:MFS family permease
MFVTGFHMILVLASSNMMLQTISNEDKRGRVISLYVLALIGAAPFGSLLAGSVAHVIGAPLTVSAGGIICILVALFFYRRLPLIRKEVQPVYRELGLVEEIPFKIQ